MRNLDIMKSIEIFREIVQTVDVMDIPVRYIAAACYIDDVGMEQVVTGDELDELMARRRANHMLAEINIMLDLKSIALDVSDEVNRLFDRLSARVDAGEY